MRWCSNKEEKYFFFHKTKQMIDQKTHGSETNRTFVPENWGWFWASVEVHVKNLENNW